MESRLTLAPLAATGVDWNDVPAVQIVGIGVGVLLLVIAIRSMFGRGGR